ncbi:hypothetical protein QBC46DRAFT_417111 [Diplogelasinospora grovesii]|uniref:Uncharacterized protein n=1 Tax=Diplogelasinospora grovesii TaxID=303347 RepID=A0AAN6N159_9PEZI|nr:hypothetical protein QBC46DRAFT_417111 [Diplogelasinospora grovesii]
MSGDEPNDCSSPQLAQEQLPATSNTANMSMYENDRHRQHRTSGARPSTAAERRQPDNADRHDSSDTDVETVSTSILDLVGEAAAAEVAARTSPAAQPTPSQSCAPQVPGDASRLSGPIRPSSSRYSTSTTRTDQDRTRASQDMDALRSSANARAESPDLPFVAPLRIRKARSCSRQDGLQDGQNSSSSPPCRAPASLAEIREHAAMIPRPLFTPTAQYVQSLRREPPEPSMMVAPLRIRKPAGQPALDIPSRPLPPLPVPTEGARPKRYASGLSPINGSPTKKGANEMGESGARARVPAAQYQLSLGAQIDWEEGEAYSVDPPKPAAGSADDDETRLPKTTPPVVRRIRATLANYVPRPYVHRQSLALSPGKKSFKLVPSRKGRLPPRDFGTGFLPPPDPNSPGFVAGHAPVSAGSPVAPNNLPTMNMATPDQLQFQNPRPLPVPPFTRVQAPSRAGPAQSTAMRRPQTPPCTPARRPSELESNMLAASLSSSPEVSTGSFARDADIDWAFPSEASLRRNKAWLPSRDNSSIGTPSSTMAESGSALLPSGTDIFTAPPVRSTTEHEPERQGAMSQLQGHNVPRSVFAPGPPPPIPDRGPELLPTPHPKGKGKEKVRAVTAPATYHSPAPPVPPRGKEQYGLQRSNAARKGPGISIRASEPTPPPGIPVPPIPVRPLPPIPRSRPPPARTTSLCPSSARQLPAIPGPRTKEPEPVPSAPTIQPTPALISSVHPPVRPLPLIPTPRPKEPEPARESEPMSSVPTSEPTPASTTSVRPPGPPPARPLPPTPAPRPKEPESAQPPATATQATCYRRPLQRRPAYYEEWLAAAMSPPPMPPPPLVQPAPPVPQLRERASQEHIPPMRRLSLSLRKKWWRKDKNELTPKIPTADPAPYASSPQLHNPDYPLQFNTTKPLPTAARGLSAPYPTRASPDTIEEPTKLQKVKNALTLSLPRPKKKEPKPSILTYDYEGLTEQKKEEEKDAKKKEKQDKRMGSDSACSNIAGGTPGPYPAVHTDVLLAIAGSHRTSGSEQSRKMSYSSQEPLLQDERHSHGASGSQKQRQMSYSSQEKRDQEERGLLLGDKRLRDERRGQWRD